MDLWKNILLPLFVWMLVLEAFGSTVKNRPFTQPDSLASIPAYHFYDSTRIVFRNAKEEFLDLYISRFTHTQVNSSEAIARATTFTVPFAFNPFETDLQAVLNQDTPLGQPYLELQLIQAEYTLIKPSGAKIEGIMMVEPIPTEIHDLDHIWRTENYLLGVPGVEAGDRVLTSITYSIQYVFNWYLLTAFRVYLDGNLPTHKLTVLVKSNENLLNDFRGVTPNYTTKEKRRITRVWERKNTPGALLEANNRAHLNVPWFEITIKKDAAQFWHRNQLAVNDPLANYIMPYYVLQLRMRERNSIWIIRVSGKERPGKQTRMLRQYVNNFESMQKTRGIETALAMHNHMAKDFNYTSDREYFLDEDLKLPKVGIQVNEKQIREISRYAIYAKVLIHLKQPFSTVYHFDNRVNKPDSANLGNLHFNDFSFLIPRERDYFVMHPKRGDLGFYVNELPYYWEQNDALIFELFKYFDDLFPFPKFLPAVEESASNQNYRYTKLLFEKNSPAIDGFVSLSGQFSTVTRHAYLGLEYPHPIPNFYNKSLPELLVLEEVELEEKKTLLLRPYTHNFDITAKIYLPSEYNFLLPLPIPELPKTKRFNPFYFDFLGTDEYVFSFPEGTISTSVVRQLGALNLHNEWFDFTLDIQNKEKTVEVLSKFTIKKQELPAAEYHQLIKLQENLKNLAVNLLDVYNQTVF
ncbi:MAG: hypothetical protein ACXITV_04805 [Luteibaculaceae bacterium]